MRFYLHLSDILQLRGGLGPVVGYLPCSPHYKPQEHNSDLINGGYEFVRPIIRISKD